jgi:hypothetical protein
MVQSLLQAGEDSLDRAGDGIVCGKIQRGFATQPQVWGHNVYYFLEGCS